MGFFRRFLSIGLGIAAAAAAVKLFREYGGDGHIEGEYVEIPLSDETENETQDAAAQ